jgi:hypothetical protein
MELLRAEVGIGGKERGNNQRSRVTRVLNLQLCNQITVFRIQVHHIQDRLPYALHSRHSFFPFPLDVSFSTRGGVILGHNDVIFTIYLFMIHVPCCLRGRGGRGLLCTRCLRLLIGRF